MAVGLTAPESLGAVAGIRLGTAALGGRKVPRDDLLVIEAVPGSTGAGVFTRNAFCAAPVEVARAHLAAHAPRYLLVNAGNANAGTGAAGVAAARRCCALVAEAGGCASEAVLPFSTGVIGEPLPVARFEAAIPQAMAALDRDGWLAGARAIMTTDTVAKGATRRFRVGATECTVTGICKGAGMIRPDMATMLAFVATDAAVAAPALHAALAGAVEASFNRVTVDGDTSTNDACVALATGASGAASIDAPEGPAYAALAGALGEVCSTLAQALVRDGEGATKFVAIEVGGGRDAGECLAVAYAIAHSPLVKTALFASDANWGRILAVVGRAGVPDLDVARVRIRLDDVVIAEGGARAPGYTEEQGAAVMAREEIAIRVDLGRGTAAETVWTCDLSHGYVTINAEYRS